ncbi:hypothetical protein [Nostoc sp. C052]|uniref:hypothetical protein n=1 Tax=Nostoc sp. C052 TaxID=2576902 RepID=UPI002118A63B|nr:hypothetical protein [Nostoc sp. C052]
MTRKVEQQQIFFCTIGKPSVTQLWQECWTADPYGSRWMLLTSALGYSTFISAKKILSDSGLFIFKPCFNPSTNKKLGNCFSLTMAILYLPCLPS